MSAPRHRFPFLQHRTQAQIMEREQAAETRRAEAIPPALMRQRNAEAADRFGAALTKRQPQQET